MDSAACDCAPRQMGRYTGTTSSSVEDMGGCLGGWERRQAQRWNALRGRLECGSLRMRLGAGVMTVRIGPWIGPCLFGRYRGTGPVFIDFSARNGTGPAAKTRSATVRPEASA